MTVSNYQAVSQDVSDTVKAWLSQAKRRISDPLVKPSEINVISKSVTSNIADVLTLRSLLSSNFPADRDLQDCSRAMANKLDSVSRLLHLDSIIRDPDNGSILLPHRQIPNIVISKQREVTSDPAVINRQQSCQPLYAVVDITNVKLFIDLLPVSVTSQLQLQFYIYMPTSETKVSCSGVSGFGEMTEQFSLIWDRSVTEYNWQPKQSAIFDLSSFHWSGTPTSNKIYLVCVASRVGTIKSACLNEEVKSSSNEQLTSNIKRPVGIAVLDLFPPTPVRMTEGRFQSLRKTRRPSHVSLLDIPEGMQLADSTPLLPWQDPAGSSYTLNMSSTASTLPEMASESMAGVVPATPMNGCQIELRLTLMQTPPLANSNAALRSKAAPLAIEPAGIHNSHVKSGQLSKFYVSLVDGMMPRGGNSRKTNAEVSVYLIQQPSPETTTVSPLFRSVVHDATEKPAWNESFVVDVDDPLLSLHLLFVIRMRSSRAESDRKSERERYFAFLPLTWKNDALVACDDGSFSLAVYRFSHERDSLPVPSTYLSMPWKYDEILKRISASTGELQVPQHRGFSTAISAALSPIYASRTGNTISIGDRHECCARNFLNVNLRFCSYQIAQSEKLASFLSLRAESGPSFGAKVVNLAGVFMELDTELWFRLLFPCFDKIFELMCFAGKTSDSEVVDVLFCKSLVNILRTLFKAKTVEGGNAMPGKYLKKQFCAPNVFLPLADALNRALSKAPNSMTPEVIVIVLKFAITSFRQYVALNANLQRSLPENIELDFKVRLNGIFRRLAELSVKETILRQQCLPDVIELISDGGFHDRSKLYETVIKDLLPVMSTDKEILAFLRFFARSHVSSIDGQRILLPAMLNKCCTVLEQFSFKSSTSNKPTASSSGLAVDNAFQVAYLALMVLQEVLNSISTDQTDSLQYSSLSMLPVFQLSLRVACLVPTSNDCYWLAINVALSCGKLMTVDAVERHFATPAFAHPLEIADFINECLMSIERLFANDASLRSMASFIYMRNAIITNVLQVFGHYIIRHLATMNSALVVSCLRQFLHSVLLFLLLPALEVEQFPENFQSQRFAALVGDLRSTVAKILLEFWKDLGQPHRIAVLKTLFQTEASLVQVALSYLPELRHIACLILKDVLKLEFECAFTNPNVPRRRSTLGGGGSILETSGCISLFLQAIDYFVVKWPHMSKQFHADFVAVFGASAADSTTTTTSEPTTTRSPSQNSLELLNYVEKQVQLLLETVATQLVFLEDYIAAVTKSPSPVAELTCLRRMIIFYHKKDQIVPYVTHLSTLYQRQLGRQMFAEAGVALEELSCLVSWTDEPLPNVLQHVAVSKSENAVQRTYKESLYEKAAELFQETAFYERAVSLYRELMDQHTNWTYDYEKLAQVHESLAGLSRMIASHIRPSPRFFWVTFVGDAASVLPCLQNTSFVFRSPSHQMMSDFAHQFKCWFPDVPVKHEPPPLHQMNSSTNNETLPAAIHIITVEPDSGELVKSKFSTALAKVPERVVAYYRSNEVERFFHVRTLKKQVDGSLRGECFQLECAYKMPYMLEWADVKLEKVMRREIDEVQLAYYDVNKKNIELRGYLDAYQSTKNDSKNAQQDLQRGVKGIVDAPIGGGIFMYAKFFTVESARGERMSEAFTTLRQLHEAVVTQHTLASEGMKCLKRVMCVNVPDLRGLYEFMEGQYAKYCQIVIDIKQWPDFTGGSGSTLSNNAGSDKFSRQNTFSGTNLSGNPPTHSPRTTRHRAVTESSAGTSTVLDSQNYAVPPLPPRHVLSTPESTILETPCLPLSITDPALRKSMERQQKDRDSKMLRASSNGELIPGAQPPVRSPSTGSDSLARSEENVFEKSAPESSRNSTSASALVVPTNGANGASSDSQRKSASPLPEGFVPFKPRQGPPPPPPPKPKSTKRL